MLYNKGKHTKLKCVQTTVTAGLLDWFPGAHAHSDDIIINAMCSGYKHFFGV